MPTRSGRCYKVTRSNIDGDLCSAYYHDDELALPFPQAIRAVTDGFHNAGECTCRWCSICHRRMHPDEIEHADDDCPTADHTTEGYALYMKYQVPGAAYFTRRYVGVFCHWCDVDAFAAGFAARSSLSSS